LGISARLLSTVVAPSVGNSLQVVPAKRRKRAPRKVPDLQKVVSVTIELLQKYGEGGLRIEDVQERTKISKSSLYLHFGSRDGLLAAAYGQMFAAHVKESIGALKAISEQVSNVDELRTALRSATAFVVSPQRFPSRVERAAIIGGVRGRPVFEAAMIQAQTTLTDEMTRLFTAVERRGLVKLAHSPRVIAQFTQAYTLGRVIAELDSNNDESTRREWIALVNDLLDHMLFDGLIDD
jgi:AcrR family transcriptional regulator